MGKFTQGYCIDYLVKLFSMSDASALRKPLVRNVELSDSSILLHQTSAGVSCLVLLITTSYYAFCSSGRQPGQQPLLWQHQTATLFTQSSTVTSIYWYQALPSRAHRQSCAGANKAVGQFSLHGK